MFVMKYDQSKFDFKKHIEDLYGCDHLETLHLLIPEKISYSQLFKVGKDSSTIFHDKFYAKLNSGWDPFLNLYREFVAHVVEQNYKSNDGDILYQKTPTFRVHLPENLAVGAFHCDSDFNHPDGEENYIIPITKMYGTNTVWCESDVGLLDFHPIPRLQIGELFMFNGNKLRHGNLVNKTGETRVSMDFRIIRKKDYDCSKKLESITTKTKFEIGKYYEKL
jgi:hypothetical protein